MKLRLHRRGAESAPRDAECQSSLRWSQRTLRLRGESPSKREVIVLRFHSALETRSATPSINPWRLSTRSCSGFNRLAGQSLNFDHAIN